MKFIGNVIGCIITLRVYFVFLQVTTSIYISHCTTKVGSNAFINLLSLGLDN